MYNFLIIPKRVYSRHATEDEAALIASRAAASLARQAIEEASQEDDTQQQMLEDLQLQGNSRWVVEVEDALPGHQGPPPTWSTRPLPQGCPSVTPPAPTTPDDQDLPLHTPAEQDLPQHTPAEQDLPLHTPAEQDLPLHTPAEQDLPLNTPAEQDLPQHTPIQQMIEWGDDPMDEEVHTATPIPTDEVTLESNIN